MNHEVYLALAKQEENQQILLTALAFLIEKKVVPNVEALAKWAEERQKKETKGDS